MPGGDGTGPLGMGPLTGRRAGFCSGLAAPGSMNPVGYGMGFGRGRGFRRMAYFKGLPGWVNARSSAYGRAYPPVAVDVKEFLNNQAEFLENQLQQVRRRLDQLGTEAE